MRMKQAGKWAVIGGLSGAACGFFGGGGGTVAVPLLRRWGGLDTRQAFATSVGVMLPLTASSLGVAIGKGSLELATAWPYWIGGALGGLLGGCWLKRFSPLWLHRVFGALLLWGGVRAVFFS